MPAEAVATLSLEGRADPVSLDRVHDLVDELWNRVPDVAVRDRHAFETAVIEVAGNIVEHGGPEVRLRVWLTVTADRVEAHFRDTGRAVDLSAADGPEPDELAEGGRGLALARAAADAVEYERTGLTNRWRVSKARTPVAEHPFG